MKKNQLIAVFTAGALFFGATSSYIAYKYMEPSRGTIYVFNNSYKAGQQVTDKMLSALQVDSTIIMSGRKAKINEQFVTPSEYNNIIHSGESLRQDVGVGTALTKSMLSVSGGSSLEMNMQSNGIAVTVDVDGITGVTNDLKSGSRVNIYSVCDNGVYLIQQNKRVIEVTKDNNELTSVSIEEDITGSMQLIYAQSYGKIYLGLVDATGYQSENGIPEYLGWISIPEETTDQMQDIYTSDNSNLFQNGYFNSDLFTQNDSPSGSAKADD